MRLKKGFTLIELLVVVAIIGVLATVVMSSLNSVRSKTRDARRLSDMRQMQNALEMYYLDNGNYPLVNDWSYAAANPSNWNRVHSAIMDYIIAPTDPINNGSYHYRYYGNLTTTYECEGQFWQNYGYVIVFRMEHSNSNVAESTYSSFNKCVHGPLK